MEQLIIDGLPARPITPTWSPALIALSIAISFLGAFTSTQLHCQARSTRYLPAVIIWLTLSSTIFCFCSIWSLHFLAMLAYEMDLKIGLNPALTLISAILAVVFTFCALASDLVYDRYRRMKRSKTSPSRLGKKASNRSLNSKPDHSNANVVSTNFVPIRRPPLERIPPYRPSNDLTVLKSPAAESTSHLTAQYYSQHSRQPSDSLTPPTPMSRAVDPMIMPLLQDERPMSFDRQRPASPHSNASTEPDEHMTTDDSDLSRTRSGLTESSNSLGLGLGLGKFASIRLSKQSYDSSNPLLITYRLLRAGVTLKNIARGLCWSFAITTMHYSGILALQIPHGYAVFNPWLVILSALISWVVCCVGIILMASMETNIGQQLLFSLIACVGVSSMHMTGMAAVTFWTTDPPTDVSGYPAALPVVIASIGILTCFAANGLLAHSATLARNKLVEVVSTRRKLWAAIAQKENAEAAAVARGEFIASASHEIRTPLHQLQGFSDLLSRTKMSDESRQLVVGMQDAIRSLSLITNNVLDWSRLGAGEAICRPTALNIRKALSSITNFLPVTNDKSQVELLVAISPEVPESLFIDESYFNRIIMNLVSNSLKFTARGHVLLTIRINPDCNVLKAVVTDTGPGIPSSFLPKLFEPYKQAQQAARGGIGLGLSIVKQLLNNMQGTIEPESRDENEIGVGPEMSGSTFTVTIPVQPAVNDSPRCDLPPRVVAVGEYPDRAVEGIAAAWAIFGVETLYQRELDLRHDDVVWINGAILLTNADLLEKLRVSHNRTIVCYNEEHVPRALLKQSLPDTFVLVRKPLVMHHIIDRLSSGARALEAENRQVRFNSVVDVLDASTNGAIPHDQPLTPISDKQFSSLKPPTILLVEDNPINQKLGGKMVKSLGFDVLLADNGQEAIDLLVASDEDIEAILMDQNMPVLDGLGATRIIREMESHGRFLKPGRRPIISVTAVVSAQAEAMCKDAGTDAFLPKPLSLAKLRETLGLFGVSVS